MKPLLRAVLVVDTLLYLAAGVLYLLTPLTSLHRALQLAIIEPALAGQLFGLALVGLAWLSLQGVINGAMTAGVAKVVGHVTWLAGVLILIWLIALHASLTPGYGVLLNALGGGVLLIVGLGGVRLSRAVQRGDKAAKARDGGFTAAPTASAAGPARAAEPVPGERSASPSAAAASAAPAPASTLTPGEQAARNAARDAAADLPGSPRPPFHG
jgi:hypothetical protein